MCRLIKILLFLPLIIVSCAKGNNGSLQFAETLANEGKYDEAISVYRKRMDSRLALKNRPQDENPYFYLILIGDIEVRRGDPEAALSLYEEASTRGVDKRQIGDRYRQMATYYAEKKDYEKAMEVLKKHREEDPLLFDSMLDRFARALIKEKDSVN